MKKVYLAVDLGAGSGRVMAALFDGKKIELSEVDRWKSEPLKCADGLHWDIESIFANVVSAMRKAKTLFGKNIVSLGIDTWGVDYGILDCRGKLLNNPFTYRDKRTEGAMREVFEKIPKGEIYRSTGIQFMPFNTLYQLAAENKNPVFRDKAKCFLMMPDLLSFMLTGQKRNERTNASTTQLYNPVSKDWAWNIIDRLGLNGEIFSSGFAEASEYIAPLKGELKDEFDDIKVVAVGSHDTASAVAAVPCVQKNPAFVNSGTWSLVGMEVDAPIISENSLKENFTNEVGVGSTVRFLKNVTGMWLVQKSKERWAQKGEDIPYDRLQSDADKCGAFRFLFNPDDPTFASPEDMPFEIAKKSYSAKGEKICTQGEIYRAVQESIAFKCAYALEKLEALSGVEIKKVNVMGGGSRDRVLNGFIANASGREVLAGPVESTALGNALMQMKAAGDIKSTAEGRRVIVDSFTPEIFLPKKSEAQIWRDAYSMYCEKVLKV